MLRSWLEDDPNAGDTWWRLADILRTKEQYEQAAQAAQKAVDIDPNNDYRPRLADCLSKAGHKEAAQSVHDTMLERHPKRSRYWYYYAKFLQDSHEPDRALKALNQIDTRSNQRWQVSEKERDELLDKITEAQKSRSVSENPALRPESEQF
jgi:tetratricopeptide (TPR) repeat protein